MTTTSNVKFYINADYIISLEPIKTAVEPSYTEIKTVNGRFFVAESISKVIELINETMWPSSHES